MEGLGFVDLLSLRFYGAATNGIGELIRIKFISGDLIEGLLYSLDPSKNDYFIITHPRRMSRANKPLFFKENYLKIPFKDILYYTCEYKNQKPKAKEDFETDVDISLKKKQHCGQNKNLIEYTIDANEELYQGNLDDDSNVKWNQFELNKQKYNVSTTYDENKYTTTLDTNLIPQDYKAKAEKIKNDILSINNNPHTLHSETNIHILEDRGQNACDDIDEDDEEAKYSSVMRQSNQKDMMNKGLK